MRKVVKTYLAVLLFLCTYSAFTQSLRIELENVESISFTDAQVVIPRTSLKGLESQFTEGFLPFITFKGQPLPSQTDDLNQDGIWDELAFVINVPSKSKVILRLTASGQLPEFRKRTQAFLAKSAGRNGIFSQVDQEKLPKDHLPESQPPLYQMEGPVWENDRAAFRLYFDARNGKDIFGKSTPAIMMDKIGLPGGDYHSRKEWGMDVLKVGKSLGAGALAFLLKDENGVEKLYRLGDKVEETGYKKVAEGPVRSIIRLTYNGVKMGNMTFKVEEQISIWAGSPGFESKVAIAGIKDSIKLVTGIVNLNTSKPPLKRNNERYALLATYDKQSENKDYLGMALLAPAATFVRFDQAPADNASITSTFLLIQAISANNPSSFEFLTKWEGSDASYSKQEVFISAIEHYARQKFNPLIIHIN